MKNFKLLLTAAVLFAVGSAFTSVNEKSKEQIYVRVGNQNVPIEQADGQCLDGGNFCKFTLDGETRIPQDSDMHFQPSN